MSPELPAEAERALLFELEADAADLAPSPVFILGAPRTGSTLIYQAVTAAFGLPFFSNFVNRFFPENPVLGLAVQRPFSAREAVAFFSRFGKTEGLFQPSEASAVMRAWFGGTHPSQSCSAEFLPGRAQPAVAACRAAQLLYGSPLVIKNAWNCFRVEAIARVFPQARFVWIRRDLRAAAKSDLHARYVVQGSPLVWNSATPANVERLRERPHVEQVVENQHEFSVAIASALTRHAQGRHAEIWYEDLCDQPITTIMSLKAILPGLPDARADALNGVNRATAESWELTQADIHGIDSYIDAQRARLSPLLRTLRNPEEQR